MGLFSLYNKIKRKKTANLLPFIFNGFSNQLAMSLLTTYNMGFFARTAVMKVLEEVKGFGAQKYTRCI